MYCVMESPQTWVALIAVIGALGTAIAALISVSLNRRELHMRLRPWVGVAKWTSSDIRSVSADGPVYQVGVLIKNFGSLPAFDVSITCSIHADNKSEKREVVKRSGLLLWPGQYEDLGWTILPPLSNNAVILNEVVIAYKLIPTTKNRVLTRQIRQYYTGSMNFVDAEEGQSHAN